VRIFTFSIDTTIRGAGLIIGAIHRSARARALHAAIPLGTSITIVTIPVDGRAIAKTFNTRIASARILIVTIQWHAGTTPRRTYVGYCTAVLVIAWLRVL